VNIIPFHLYCVSLCSNELIIDKLDVRGRDEAEASKTAWRIFRAHGHVPAPTLSVTWVIIEHGGAPRNIIVMRSGHREVLL
jgi:hypothetical protein